MATCFNPVKEAECESALGPYWDELPKEITANILRRLSTIDLLTRVCEVCPQWWNVCKDPLMWRTINITNFWDEPFHAADLEEICCIAIKRSCGHLEEINIECFGTDYILRFIALNADIRCLRIANCRNISNRVFSEAVRKLPQLEKLDISHCDLSEDSVEAIGRSCPLLKSFKFTSLYRKMCSDADLGFVIAETMQGLYHLDIEGTKLTNDSLLAILDSCPLLESLRIRASFNLCMSDSLMQRCRDQIKSLRLSGWENMEDSDTENVYEYEYTEYCFSDDDYDTDDVPCYYSGL